MNPRAPVLWLLALALLCFRAEANFNDLGSGVLLLDFDSGSGTHWVAPGLATAVDIRVTGPIVRASLTQTFRNPGSEWASARYVFPLPETAAVDRMTLVVGERIIEGQIREKAQARRVYEAAKRAGQKASLVSQQRSNLFTTHIANIPPGEEIEVRLEYQHPVDKAGDVYSLRFPMTLTPRYIPGTPLTAKESGEGWSPDTDAVPDASQITPPWAPAGNNNHPTSISVSLKPGFALAQVGSDHHPLQRTPGEVGETRLTVDPGAHSANRDFVLRWSPAARDAPQTALFTEGQGDDRYSLLMLTPPTLALAEPVPPREVIFVIDTSGSMGGESIRQARTALAQALDRLRTEDSFNIIEFNSGSWALFPQSRSAAPATVARGKSFVRGLQARGGTEMAGAMAMALCGDCSAAGKIRQVIFLTDGAIGNEDQLFRLISTRLASTRLFTVGIGGAPNSHFMRKAAEIGRGTFTYIAKAEAAGEVMAQLFATLERPLLTNINIAGDGDALDITPDPLPDIYAGKPAVLLIRGNLPPSLTLGGSLGDRPWAHRVDRGDFQTGEGIAALWGRQKIEQGMDLYRFSHDPKQREAIKGDIIDIALKHHLVSAFTSLVAVDVTPARDPGTPVNKRAIANNSPTGTHFGLTNTAAGAGEKLLAGLVLALLSLGLIGWQMRAEGQATAAQLAIVRALRRENP